MFSSIPSMQNLVGAVFIGIIVLVVLVIVGRSVLKDLNIIKNKHGYASNTYDTYKVEAPTQKDDNAYTANHIIIGPSPEQEAADIDKAIEF